MLNLFKRNYSIGEIEEEIVELELVSEKIFVYVYFFLESGIFGECVFFDRCIGKIVFWKRWEYWWEW